ncbi:hypothetical protein Bca101_055206 [Brassica carinata]
MKSYSLFYIFYCCSLSHLTCPDDVALVCIPCINIHVLQVFDPPVSVYKGYSLPREEYLSSVGMKNPLCSFC